MESTFVKLLPNSSVKDFLKEAQITGKAIEVTEEGSFFVRDAMTNELIFRGLRVRSDLWGLTFVKKFYSKIEC